MHPKMSLSYTEWSEAIKRLKQFKCPVDSSIKEVVDCYKRKIAEGDKVRRDEWSQTSGFRKHSKGGRDRGEQAIERLLFNHDMVKLVREGRRALPITVSDHNFAMTKSKKGQVICDAFCFLKHKHIFHPLTIEVKDKADNVWFAVVECLIQVRLARRNLQGIEKWALKKRLTDQNPTMARGAWGLVIAPQKYFDRKKEILTAALRLIQRLKKETKARIILASSDNLAEGRLRWVAGSYWPS
jgi:hypothetical protein